MTVAERLAGPAAGTAGAIVWMAGNPGGLVVALLVQALVHHPTAAFLAMAPPSSARPRWPRGWSRCAGSRSASGLRARGRSEDATAIGARPELGAGRAGTGNGRGRAPRGLIGEPVQHLGGVAVRGEDGVEDLRDSPPPRDESQAPVEPRPGRLEGGQPQALASRRSGSVSSG